MCEKEEEEKGLQFWKKNDNFFSVIFKSCSETFENSLGEHSLKNHKHSHAFSQPNKIFLPFLSSLEAQIFLHLQKKIKQIYGFQKRSHRALKKKNSKIFFPRE